MEWQMENYIFKQIMKRPEEVKKLERSDVADSGGSVFVSRNDESVQRFKIPFAVIPSHLFQTNIKLAETQTTPPSASAL